MQTFAVGDDSAHSLRQLKTSLFVALIPSLFVFASALARSSLNGRLAAPMTHNDVNYFVEGIQHLVLLQTKGLRAIVFDFFHGTMHAPLATYQAMSAYLVFGINDWAPYASNFIFVFLFFFLAAYLLRDCPVIARVAILAGVACAPLLSNTVTEFAPELTSSLFVSVGALLWLTQSALRAAFWERALAGFCFCIGFLAHPSAFPFTSIALIATLVMNLLLTRLSALALFDFRTAFKKLALNVLLSIWLPAFYMVPRREEYIGYFYNALFNASTRWVWATEMSREEHLRFYLDGGGGQFMFGNKLIVYLCIIAGSLLIAFWRKTHKALFLQLALLLLSFLFWILPTLSVIKVPFFASAFGYTVIFLTAISFCSICNAVPEKIGAAIVCVLCAGLVLTTKPWDNAVPNTPDSITNRELTFTAIDRLKSVLAHDTALGNPVRVYTTNIGAYAPNILQYYMLKSDPLLNWTFDSHWQDQDVDKQLNFIDQSRQTFVIAGQRDNGFTYSPFAMPAEDELYDAIWKNAAYTPIDRFYGLNGRFVAIFERRGRFGGFRAVSGIDALASVDGSRQIPKGLAHLQAFSPVSRSATLAIEWGGNVGQKLDVWINYRKTAELVLDGTSQVSAGRYQINLDEGNNEVLLTSERTFYLTRLSIAPDFDDRTTAGITVLDGTYGGNCGALRGNVSAPIALECNGKSSCQYSVEVDKLGDPASGCRKDFAASYLCTGDAAVHWSHLPSEAGFGSVATLGCPSPRQN